MPNDSNIADGGSREGVTDPVTAVAGISLKQCTFPLCLEDLVYTLPAAWANHW